MVAAAALLAGCAGNAGSGGSGGTSGASGDDLKIGYAGFALDTAFLSTLASEVEAAGEEAGATVTVTTADADPAKQANDINTLVTGGAQGILVDPVNADAVVPAINKAAQAGAKVVVIDGTASDAEGISIQVATDNYGAGAEGCAIVGDLLDGEATVLNLQGGLDNQAAQGRTNGFEECMAENYPDITVISKSYNWDAAECAQIVQTQFSSTQIDGVFAASAQCLGPVESTLEAQGRLVPSGQEGHIPFAIVDGTPEELEAVRSGTLTASIVQPLGEMASAGVYWLERAIAGESIEEGPTDHGTEVVESGGTLRDLLDPIVVTSENVDDPALWGNQ
ncbi:sugar ABC transporter substrate-binding protein [Microbacterium sp. DT81.1]|uniref:sugar ABC transporter substrate-binding protein n=1 Tax=Microbacterium sp. DT81.1 TaxID=3393413 RepID=UPI003CF6DF05